MIQTISFGQLVNIFLWGVIVGTFVGMVIGFICGWKSRERPRSNGILKSRGGDK